MGLGLWTCNDVILTSSLIFKISGSGAARGQADIDNIEAELEADLENMKLDDIDTSDVNLDDEGLLED